jgi:ATPase family associated with various cellular activities (AAA)
VNLATNLKDYILAAFSGIWIQTFEPDEAQREIAQLCEEEQWHLRVWDIARGDQVNANTKNDPIAPLEHHYPIIQNDKPQTSILILHNYHRFFGNPITIQTLANTIVDGKADRLFVIVLSPIVQIPVELEKLFVVIEHDLPDTSDLTCIAAELDGIQQAKEIIAITKAAAGLTRYEAEGAFALSLTKHGKLKPETVWELKASTLKKSGLLEMYRGQETFANLGGLDALKTFCRKALTTNGTIHGRGVLLLGVSGTGKSAFAKALGNETGRPALALDIGALMGSLVGQTEGNIRSALKIADAMQPCILFLDEVEKALAGHNGGQGDSGVATRLFGTLLTWLNDHTSDVFVVATSNDVSKLPPEFARAERWDGIFFIDLPTEHERKAIWDLYTHHYCIKPDGELYPNNTNWTGAEIKSCCRLAALLDTSLEQAAQHVIPIAQTNPEKVSALREWASGRCLSASLPGVFNHQAKAASNGVQPSPKPRRSLKEKQP